MEKFTAPRSRREHVAHLQGVSCKITVIFHGTKYRKQGRTSSRPGGRNQSSSCLFGRTADMSGRLCCALLGSRFFRETARSAAGA